MRLECKCGCGYTVGRPPAVVAGKRPGGEVRAEIATLEARLAALYAEQPSTFPCLQCGRDIECADEVRAHRKAEAEQLAAEAAAADAANAEAEGDGS